MKQDEDLPYVLIHAGSSLDDGMLPTCTHPSVQSRYGEACQPLSIFCKLQIPAELGQYQGCVWHPEHGSFILHQ